MEPKFDETVDQFFIEGSGPVYLVKQDGAVSEQTFVVVVQVTNSVPNGSNFQPATLGEDYSVGSSSVEFLFPFDLQFLLVPVTLLSDNIPEGTESFLMTLGDLGIRVIDPEDLSPTALSAETFVIIEDDDG